MMFRRAMVQAPRLGARHFSATRAALDIVTFNMADVGEGIKEVEVKQWFVKVGDEVNEFDPLCEIQSDKATVEITSLYTGKITKIYTDVGDMQQVGMGLVDVDAEGVEAEEEAPAAAAPAADAAPAAAAAPAADAAASTSASGAFVQSAAGAKVLTTPAVRRIAAENAIDLTKVPATGKGGRVTKEDIINFMDGTVAAAKPAAAATSSGSASSAPVWTPEDRTEKIGGITRIMVKSMTESLKIPAFGAGEEINMNNLVAVRAALKPLAEAKGAKLSYMPFFIKAASLALKAYPVVNSQLDGAVENLTYKGAHNIGIAMDTAQGLIVPNVKNVQSKSILQIAEDLNALQQRGASGSLTRDDLQDGTFTLSNIGSIGGTYVSPIIMAPQVAIGALGKITKQPRYNAKSGAIEEQNILYVSWTADHRVIDGATMVRFSNVWKQLLEDPAAMLLETA